jgi:hypothetical protein
LISVAVSEEDSIMYYEAGEDWRTYNNNSFVPLFTDDVDNWNWTSSEFRNKSYALCGEDTACLIDVYITGDLAIGESSKATAEESAKISAALGMYKSDCQ